MVLEVKGALYAEGTAGFSQGNILLQAVDEGHVSLKVLLC